MKRNSILYFDKPANSWIEGLPLGNGNIGAMVMGYAGKERVCLNHENIWRKIANRKTIPVARYLHNIRQLFLKGKWEEGAQLLEAKLQPTPADRQCATEEYQPACDLIIKVPCSYPVEDYMRILDLATGIATIKYRLGRVRYERTYFVSAVHDLFVVKIKADHKQAISGTVWFERESTSECNMTTRAKENYLTLEADIRDGTSFVAEGKIICKGGTLSISSDSNKIMVSGTDEMLILITIATDKETKDLQEVCRKKLSSGVDNIDVLMKKHVMDHKKLFQRVSFSLGQKKEEENLTTDRLLHSAYLGNPGGHLFEMIFDMGRYLMMASSRQGTKAITLQGIWNHEMHPPWQSDWHLDMNVQMNYWLAEVGNLSECSLPLFELVKSLISDGEDNAKNLYGCKGVVFPIAFAGKGVTLPGPWVAWTGAAGWLAQHFWWHYEYSMDFTFLKNTAYPYMKKVAEFYEDFLIKDKSGKYMVVPSLSPENTPSERKNPEISGVWKGYKLICVNATMDIAIIKELLGNLVKASMILDCDSEKRKIWQEILDNLPDWPIDKNGMLKEWVSETNLDNHHHRHFSHLYPLFPGNMFSLEETPELVNAAAKALHGRQAVGCTDNTGWSYPYMAMFHARLGEGDKALQCLAYLAKSCMMDNLLTIHNDWRFQGLSLYWKLGDRAFMIETILGASAAIAEMLLQSHNGLIRILPALPQSWDRGEIKGLRARGGFEIDIKWELGRIEQVTIHSLRGQLCRVKLCQPHRKLKLKCGRSSIIVVQIKDKQIRFKTEAGKTYQLLQKKK